ncbi:MAG: SDR family oxidoreductase [Proteobacteria bacterium]|nr:SDR family oxidoreductase [Pseudomonadota bacterium]
MASDFPTGSWALVLGGSSGFGLATAQKLAEQGMNIAIVHRDRRGAMSRIEPEFEKIRGQGVQVQTWNADAISPEKRDEVLGALAERLGGEGRVRVLLHSIAFGNLKLIAPEFPAARTATQALADKLGIDAERLREAADELFEAGEDGLHTVNSPAAYPTRSYLDEEDFSRTILCMGTSLLGWTQGLFERGLFAEDARVFGLTSEGNEVAWKGYAAVSAAKVALESLARSIALEFGPHGVRCNVIQAGVTETPALAAIPGSAHLKAQARLRNPMGRLTTPRDVANMIYLLARDEAAWVNGELIRVDGGEHISGASR